MPTKDAENTSVVFLKDESGRFTEIVPVDMGDVENLGTFKAISIDDMHFEMTGILSGGLTRNDLFLILFCGYKLKKIKQNNWRKMHRIPMRRKIRK